MIYSSGVVYFWRFTESTKERHGDNKGYLGLMSMYNGTLRGQKRRLNVLLKRIEEIKPYQRIENTQKRGFEHFHVPSTVWIEQPKTSSKIKTAFCKAWIKKTEEIFKAKPEGIEFCRVVCVLSIPNLWDSQIIIFYDKKYYDSFWNRHGGWQDWSRLENGLSLKEERNIVTDLKETGFIETITDEDRTSTSYLWFYGEVNENI